MRQDIGVDGDATRLSQMVWLIFLKILDDEDKALEIRKEKFVSTLSKKYQWSTWAGPLDGMTGEKLIEFVNNDLLPGLRDLPASSNKRTELTRMAFQDVYNFMRKGTLLKQVINKINEIDFNASKDRHAFNEIYERLLKSLQSAGNFGEMYTPRAVTQFIVEMVDPKIGESVLDPAVGTGGFLVHSLEHMRKQVKSVKDEHKIQESIYGVEKKPLPFMLLITNMMLHGIEEPVTMRRGNTLEKPLREYTDADKVNCIVTNPPFGGTEEPGIESNFPKEFQTRETADLFLVLIMRLLKKNGRAGLVLPDGTLFGEGIKTAIKKQFLEDCNLHTIVRLPKNVFAPYTDISTNLLFFTKGVPTKEIWYYEHSYPIGQKSYSMTSPIKFSEFENEKIWWHNRVENEHAWKVSIDEIKLRNYDLDIKNPNHKPVIAKTPDRLLTEYRKKQKDIKRVSNEIQSVISKSLTHHELMPRNIKIITDNINDFVHIEGGIDLLRKEILSLAFSGKLVEQESKEGDAADLYQKVVSNLNLKKKNKPLSKVSKEEIPFKLPTSWMWVRLGEIAAYMQRGKGPDYVEKSDYPVISQKCVRWGQLNWAPVKFVNPETIDRYDEVRLLKDGDVLINSTGTGTIGRACSFVTNSLYTKAVADSHVTVVRSEALVPEFLINWISTEFVQSTLEGNKASGSTNQIEWNLTALQNEVVPLPTLAEQKRIVKKIEEVMLLVSKLKQIVGEK